MRSLVASLALVLSGCAHFFGPAHGYLDVVGITPDGGTCQLIVGSVGARHAPSHWDVVGRFRQRVMIGPSSSGHRLVMMCDNKIVSERTFTYGRDVRIGGELQVSAAAPNNSLKRTDQSLRD